MVTRTAARRLGSALLGCLILGSGLVAGCDGDGDETGTGGTASGTGGTTSGGTGGAVGGSGGDGGTSSGTGGSSSGTGGSSSGTGGSSSGTGGAGGDGGDAGAGGDGGSGGSVNPDAPGDVTELEALPAHQSSYVTWVPPTDPDYDGVLLLRRAGVPVADVPTVGATYTVGGTLGASQVVFAADGTNVLDTGLTNGTTYHYRAFAYDGDLNYAPGQTDSVTPRNPHPGSHTDYVISDLDAAIGSIDMAIDGSDNVHLAISTSASYYYASCTGGCDAANDWQVTWLDSAPSNRGPHIVVDGGGNPRMAYPVNNHTGYRSCNSGCHVAANWSTTELAGTGNAPRAMTRDANGAIWIAGAGSSIEVSRCTNGCSSATNWTTILLPAAASYLGDLQVNAAGQVVLLSHQYANNYELHHWSCASNCLTVSSWTSSYLTHTQGSVPPVSYRFTVDGLGARSFYPPFNGDYRYLACDSCAPSGMGQQQYVFPSSEVYNGHGMEITDHNQPRVFTDLSSGAAWYRTCDYRCDQAPNWSAWQATPPSYDVAMKLQSNELPYVVFATYGTNGINRLNARKPSP